MVPRKYLDKLTGVIKNALGERLRAVYLTGSAAVGAYVPGTSDIDVLVAVDRAERAALERLAQDAAHGALPCPARKLELVVYQLATLAKPGERPRWSLNLNTGEHEHHVGFDPDLEPAHWFVLDLAFAPRHAQALVGPPPSELIADPAEDAIGRAFEAMVAWYEMHEPEHAEVARKRARHWHATHTFMAKPGLPSDHTPP